MDSKVDYLSISIKYPRFYTWVKGDETGHVKSELVPRFRKIFNLIDNASDIVKGGGRAPFNRSWFSAKCGFTYFESDKLSTSLIEITGKGCDYLRSSGWLENVMRDFKTDVTRIDVCSDFESDIDPRLFASERSVGRFESHEIKVSQSGVTCYVGSKTSSRYARVYRYYPPHPRHSLLRVEHVFKGEQTVPIIEGILVDGVQVCAVACGNTFGWKNSLWADAIGVQTEPKKIGSVMRESRQGSTDRWLLKAVVPALDRMLKSGNREMVEYFYGLVGALLKESK